MAIKLKELLKKTHCDNVLEHSTTNYSVEERKRILRLNGFEMFPENKPDPEPFDFED